MVMHQQLTQYTGGGSTYCRVSQLYGSRASELVSTATSSPIDSALLKNVLECMGLRVEENSALPKDI